GIVLVLLGWSVTAFFGWCDPATLAVQALSGGVMLWLALRWTLRHQSCQGRFSKDRGEAEEKQSHLQGAVEDLKEKISTKAADVDRGLKQYELVKRLAEAVSWEEMAPS